MCVALGDGGTAWALDASGSLWFRTGISSSKPQGDDDHWWQVDKENLSVPISISLYCLSLTCVSLSDQYFRLRGLRSGESVSDSAAGHSECCHGDKGTGGAGGGFPVTVLSVPAKSGQCQRQRSLGRLGTEPAAPGSWQPCGSVETR